MGYWECPRCGSNDTYEGTEIVSGQTPTSTVIVDSEFGMMGRQQGGETIHKQLSVPKCRKCDTLLSRKDWKLTAEDIQEQHDRLLQAEKDAIKERKCNWWFSGFLIACIPFTIILMILLIDPSPLRGVENLQGWLCALISSAWSVVCFIKWRKAVNSG